MASDGAEYRVYFRSHQCYTMRRRSLASKDTLCLMPLMASVMTCNIADGFIDKLEAIHVTTHHCGSMYYIVALKVYVWCTIMFGVPVACKLNVCVYAPLVIRG